MYLDNAATQEVSVISKMAIKEGLTNWGNPSSQSDLADKAKSIIRVARERVASSIGAKSEKEIVFTSGGTESSNMAIKGVVFASTNKHKHIIVSKIEHKAVLETCKFLERYNLASVTYIDVDADGVVKLGALEKAITDDTILISVMAVNNEIGTIQPIRKIGEIAKKYGVLFHTDYVQAYGKTGVDVNSANIDLLSASGHKIGTPKGIGFLYIKSGTLIEPLIHGGGQEFGLRAGTENVPYINALGYEASGIDTAAYQCNIKNNTSRLVRELVKTFGEELFFSVDPTKTLGVITIGFSDMDAFAMQAFLSLNNIQVSIGSACNTGNKEPSYVLQAIEIPEDMLYSYIRVSVPENLSDKDIQQFIRILSVGKKLYCLPKKG